MCKEGKTSVYISQPALHTFWVNLGLFAFPLLHIHSEFELEMSKVEEGETDIHSIYLSTFCPLVFIFL